ncbi:acylphosphatase [Ectothiorhodospira mobilis]|uniref:acylphosphatase n=1 Tax=Ectothiorhodospira mobilis TaxID=195064 RepID=UPI0019056921|nr:acylphosphatase [Ectothiorhodospira mobilis]MBK1692721.1 acylphosphatase [Ectothiorhodospira mobilis]
MSQAQEPSLSAIRCRIRGRVQGVYFRASTQRRARELGLCGYAMNLPDGDVEVVARGEAGALEALKSWLWQGPPAARVTAVHCEAFEGTVPAGFETR